VIALPDRLLRLPAILESGISNVVSVFDAFGVGIYCVDLDGCITYINPAGESLLGWRADDLRGRHVHELIHHTRPDGTPFPRPECRLYEALTHGLSQEVLDDVFWAKDGTPVQVGHTIAPLNESGERVGAIVVFSENGRRRRDIDLLRARATQQAAVADLGLEALGGGSLQALLDHTCDLVARTLELEFSQVLELVADTDRLQLRAGVGWHDGVVGRVTVAGGSGSLSGFAIAADETVVVDDLRTETRFTAPRFLLDHEVVSGITVVIHGGGRPHGTEPWGVLGAHTRLHRTFTADEIGFLHTLANSLALAIERNDAERELRQRNSEIVELAAQVAKLADDRRRIMADALDAEDRTRERISQVLHDEVLQSLLATRQDLAKATGPGATRADVITRATEGVVAAIGELRNAVVALHPVTLERDGVLSAIRTTADFHAMRAGFEVALDVDPEAGGPRDQLVVSLAQELLNNAAQHAEAAHVGVTLRRGEDAIVLEVVDDGCGMDPDRAEQALDQGHIGLASIALRVESLGGRVDLDTSPGRGTRVRATIPDEAPARSP
jgi:PAS domain S-box-containing protein